LYQTLESFHVALYGLAAFAAFNSEIPNLAHKMTANLGARPLMMWNLPPPLRFEKRKSLTNGEALPRW
jgi:hypothetical protein